MVFSNTSSEASQNEARPLSNSYVRRVQLLIIGVAILLVGGGIGYRLGERAVPENGDAPKKVVVNTDVPDNRAVDFALFWDVWSRLEQNYIDRDALDPEKMVHGAISGMVSSLGDPYTVFLPPKSNKEFKDDLGGNLEGIGAQLGLKDERIMVIAPLKGTPAERAGIKAGDVILKVDDAETTGWTVPEAVTKIRGTPGTSVKLTVWHEGDSAETDIAITRDKITIPSVELSIIEATGSGTPVAHVSLLRFGDQTNQQWDGIISEINTKPEIRGVVLDLRNNPGGYLQGAIYIASEFIPNGVVVKQENSNGTSETFSVMRAGKYLTKPVVVLLNKGSASASEILAGALRDHKRATLVGEKSFGKGSVQTPQDLPDGSGLHITTAKWLLPNGEWINGKGIMPEIASEPDKENPANDVQLARAIEVLVTAIASNTR